MIGGRKLDSTFFRARQQDGVVSLRAAADVAGMAIPLRKVSTEIQIIRLKPALKEEYMKIRVLLAVVSLALTIFLMGCPRRTTINQLVGDPERFRNRDVLIYGTVTNSYGALGQGAYELDDETGKIWVVTQRGVPGRGARVGAVGRFIEGVSWGGRNLGSAIRESDRRTR